MSTQPHRHSKRTAHPRASANASQAADMFRAEELLLARAAEVLERGTLDAESARAVRELMGGFERLLRQAGRLVTMGDRMQATLARLNAKLGMEEQRFRSIFEHAAEGIFRTGPDGRFAEVNPAMAAIFGWPSPEALMAAAPGVSSLLLRDEDRLAYARALRSEAGVLRLEAPMRRRDGSTVWTELSAQPQAPGVAGIAEFAGRRQADVVGVLLDVTERRSMLERLSAMARTDPLTGLSNRRHFMEQASREAARAARAGTPVSLVILDADHFKNVNDTYGHDIGDVVLRALGDTLRSGLRDEDVVARFGGEEFVALLPATELSQAMGVAERIRRAVEAASVHAPGRDGAPEHVRFSVSAGVTCAVPDVGGAASYANFLDKLLKQADIALYAAKRKGRNRVEAYPGEGCACPGKSLEPASRMEE